MGRHAPIHLPAAAAFSRPSRQCVSTGQEHPPRKLERLDVEAQCGADRGCVLPADALHNRRLARVVQPAAQTMGAHKKRHPQVKPLPEAGAQTADGRQAVHGKQQHTLPTHTSSSRISCSFSFVLRMMLSSPMAAAGRPGAAGQDGPAAAARRQVGSGDGGML